MITPLAKTFNFFSICVNLTSKKIMPQVKCPSCGKQTEYYGNDFRPFCSERCKLLDFGAWANEEFALPLEETSLSEEDFEKIERALKEKGNL